MAGVTVRSNHPCAKNPIPKRNSTLFFRSPPFSSLPPFPPLTPPLPSILHLHLPCPPSPSPFLVLFHSLRTCRLDYVNKHQRLTLKEQIMTQLFHWGKEGGSICTTFGKLCLSCVPLCVCFCVCVHIHLCVYEGEQDIGVIIASFLVGKLSVSLSLFLSLCVAGRPMVDAVPLCSWLLYTKAPEQGTRHSVTDCLLPSKPLSGIWDRTQT